MDIDRITTLLERSGATAGVSEEMTDGAAGLLRQMVHLPHAALLVAEANRHLAGFAVLALHPSIRRGGMVGTIDLLVVEPGPEEHAMSEALLSELIRSARKKGCVVVEATAPEGTMEQERWKEQGFDAATWTVERQLGRVRAVPR
jgi:GNAT superfamily N-acetyltransferase